MPSILKKKDSFGCIDWIKKWICKCRVSQIIIFRKLLFDGAISYKLCCLLWSFNLPQFKDWPLHGIPEAATGAVLWQKLFLEIAKNSQENACARVSFLIKLQVACNFVKKETLAQVFSCEFCEIPKNTFSTEHLRDTVFAIQCLAS